MKLYTEGLMGHQQAGVSWLLDNPKGMLAWQMRCGKTATAARAAEHVRMQEPGATLVLCPATGRENWRREAIRFAIDASLPPKVQVLANPAEPLNPAADIVVTNYDKLLNPNVIKRLRARKRWSSIILDEAHALKTADARRTKLVYGGGQHKQTPLVTLTEHVWPLTGTPMLNHPGEMWTHANALWPQAIVYRDGKPMEEWEFQLGFCEIRQTEYGHQIIGGKNLGELKARLSPYMNRLKLRDVMEMPPFRIDTWPLDMDGVGTSPNTPELSKKLTQVYGAPQEIEKFDNDTVSAYLACIAAESAHYATIRRETGILKSIATGLLVAEELEAGGPKTVVFAYHREAIDVLSKALSKFNPATLRGGMGSKVQDEIDRFTNDPTCRVLVGQLLVAGQLHDLSASANFVFAETDWVPGINEQAVFRGLGPKQKEPVLVRFAYLPGSIDELVNRANARKAKIIAEVID